MKEKSEVADWNQTTTDHLVQELCISGDRIAQLEHKLEERTQTIKDIVSQLIDSKMFEADSFYLDAILKSIED